jgi:hypothetical protein
VSFREMLGGDIEQPRQLWYLQEEDLNSLLSFLSLVLCVISV